ncbi:centlein-like isoform X2 [Dendronephthya gigantea]|uniref:centlein-like isoform X2 n=1 Tax=Dendronephthya gigantea TaxID=151771 RepID=UPI00106CFBCB|nr:centlein-like isoform X2 [Dendronephthya gigantea]
MAEENEDLKNQLNGLQEQLKSLKQEHQDGMTTLRLREQQLQQHSSLNQEHKDLLGEKDNMIQALRQEMSELKLVHEQCGIYAKEQSTLIQNLQSLQDQTQTVIKAQEEKFKSEVIDLKEQLKDSIKLRESLQADIEQSKLQECEECITLKDELQTVKDHNNVLLEKTQEKNRRISSLEKTLVAKDNEQTGNSPSGTLERKIQSAEQKIFDLQKVLEFKQNELDSLNAAHSNRLLRYKNLQHEHKIVLKQLKTFEISSDNEAQNHVEDTSIPRASPRSLQNENSDSVWNELQHFKTEYETLRNERDSIMEEIDSRRVEHANDVTTIQELRMCLEDEKRGLVEQIRANNVHETEELKKTSEQLKNDKNELKFQIESLRKNWSGANDDNESLTKRLGEQELLVERLAGEIAKYKKELKIMKSERKKRKENDERKVLLQEKTTSAVGRKKSIQFEKQTQTDSSFKHQQHKTTKKLIQDNSSFQHNHRDAQTSPIRTFAELSNSVEPTSHGDPTTRVSDLSATHDESITKDGDEMLDPRDQSARSAFETPAKRSRMRTKSPAHRESKSMRQRVLSLTQQVAALKSAKDSLAKSLTEQKFSNEKLQHDLNLSQQRAKVSRQTVERLSKELDDSHRQNQTLLKASKDYKIPSYPTEKHLEDRLKLSANECSRLSHELKSARKTNEELQEKLKSLQEKNSRNEHILNQKKVFVDEMRSRLKATLSNLETTQEGLQKAEERNRQMTENENQRKNQMDFLKSRLETEIKEKKEIDKLYSQSQEEIKRKAKLLTRAQALRHEAEMAVNEMEEAAKTQLHNLANQSQVTLGAIEQRLNESRRKLGEFQIFVRTLTHKLTDRVKNKRSEIKQINFQKFEDEKQTASMVQACELASSILNMSKLDINEFLDVSVHENEDSLVQDQIHEWRTHVEEILSNEGSFATSLAQFFIEIVENLVVLEKRIDGGQI